MPVYETFAKRKRMAANAGKPTIFRQNVLPDEFRRQVVHIFNDAIGSPQPLAYPQTNEARRHLWQQSWGVMVRELGVFALVSDQYGPQNDCYQFILIERDVDQVLSTIEVIFAIAQQMGPWIGDRISVNDGIDELNHRFREHAIGYQFQGGQIISVESQYLHTEAVEPTIQLLHDANFAGPLEEFMQAHEHFRKGNHKDAIVNAQNAFESTMKAICDQRGWIYRADRAAASHLIDVLFAQELIPHRLQSHFSALRSTLESGLPTVRNQPGQGGHGQGSDVVEVPDYLAAYCLHLAATNIVLLIEAHNATK